MPRIVAQPPSAAVILAHLQNRNADLSVIERLRGITLFLPRPPLCCASRHSRSTRLRCFHSLDRARPRFYSALSIPGLVLHSDA
jgi:hypothetical protein